MRRALLVLILLGLAGCGIISGSAWRSPQRVCRGPYTDDSSHVCRRPDVERDSLARDTTLAP